MGNLLARLMGACLFFFGMNTLAGDLTCKDGTTGELYTSTTSHFACLYPTGNCTWWAAYMRPDLADAGITGDAGYWCDNAENLNFLVGPDPREGAIAVFSRPGHVAYVESFKEDGDGSFDVSEMDATGKLGSGVLYATYHPNSDGTYNRNGLGSWTLRGFIYEKDPATISLPTNGNYAWEPRDGADSCFSGLKHYRVDDGEIGEQVSMGIS